MIHNIANIVNAIIDDEDAAVTPVTLDEAKQLPNMLGRIAPAMLTAHGVYRATVDGVRIKFVLR